MTKKTIKRIRCNRTNYLSQFGLTLKPFLPYFLTTLSMTSGVSVKVARYSAR